MRRMLLPACLLLAAAPLSQRAEACDVPPRFGLSPLAVAIRNTACNEHRLWYRPFIDREGRAASLSVTEAESDHLADNGLIAWQRVAGYREQRHAQRDGQHRRRQQLPGTAGHATPTVTAARS